MKYKLLIWLLGLICTFSPLSGETGGYLSFEYRTEWGQGNAQKGFFGNSEAGIIFAGPLSGRFEYAVEVSLKQEDRFRIEQAWVRYLASQAFILKIGVYPVPFGWYNEANRPQTTVLVNSPLPVFHLFPTRWRDVGVQVEGKISGISYSLYLGNGLTEAENLSLVPSFRENNGDKGKGGRIGLELSESINFSYSRYWGKYDGAGERDIRLEAFDVRAALLGIDFEFERIWGKQENPEGFSSGEWIGYFILASFEIDRFRPYASYQEVDYRDDYHGPGFILDVSSGSGIIVDRSRWAAGLVYNLTETFLIKLEYDWNREKDFEISNDMWVLQAALNF